MCKLVLGTQCGCDKHEATKGDSRYADLLVSLGVTTVGYERIVFGEFSFEPVRRFQPGWLVDFGDYLEFLNYYDAGC